jgi:hypothetical protein
MYKFLSALSVFTVLPFSASLAATAFGGGNSNAAPAPVQMATIYNADGVGTMFIQPEIARGAVATGGASGLKVAAQAAGYQHAAPARAVSGSFGVSSAVINAPGNSGGSNVITDAPSQPNNNQGGGSTVPPSGPSTMTINQCMDAIEGCVNTSLPGGIRNLFDENMRNSIFNGMNLCHDEIEKCRADVRAEVRVTEGALPVLSPIYGNNIDVWVDFNSRRIQPQYYAFTLSRTGLTPRQAEAVCKLIDRNTFGSSFAAVGIDNKITTEYAKGVTAYNEQGSVGFKGDKTGDQPQGMDINMHNKVDAMRGYYARWDAEQAECLIRVAAYNGNDIIQNRWTAGVGFGSGLGFGVGDGKYAEQWKNSGESFKCGKGLFGFSLLNETAENAIGGAVIGGAAGAITGAVTVNNELDDIDCSNKSDRKKLQEILMSDRWRGCYSIAGSACATQDAEGATKNASSIEGDAGVCRDFVVVIKAGADKEKLAKEWGDKNMGRAARAGVGGAIGAAGGAGLASAITYFVESNNITCRVGDNLEKVGYDKSFTIPTLKEFYVKWALNLPDSTSSNPLPIMNRSDWEKACGSAIATDRASCEELKVNYRREGLLTGMQIWNACMWTGNANSGSCGLNRITCLSYGVCTLADVVQ